jgi:hypothetical protein
VHEHPKSNFTEVALPSLPGALPFPKISKASTKVPSPSQFYEKKSRHDEKGIFHRFQTTAQQENCKCATHRIGKV